MEKILEIANRHRGAVVEDNAHGFLGKYRGKHLGSFGPLATLSFHETKNFTCGEGGALLINDPQLVQRAEIIREKGTNRSRFFRGEVDKYTWVDVGSSYLLSDILAAFLYAQLEVRDLVQARRKRIWNFYYRELVEWAARNKVRLPYVPDECEQPYHLFYLVFPSLETRQSMITHLASRRVSSIFHYQPLHLSKMGRQFGGREGDCPVTEQVSDCLLRLPFHYDLTEEDQMQVVTGIKDFKTHTENYLEVRAPQS
jgi:dTDP-4-amino-4,6-dideoxygalactose transaminase